VLRSSKQAQVIGNVLKNTRLKAGLTQEQLAANAGMDRSYLSDVERGATSVSVDTFLRICRGMKVPASKVIAEINFEN